MPEDQKPLTQTFTLRSLEGAVDVVDGQRVPLKQAHSRVGAMGNVFKTVECEGKFAIIRVKSGYPVNTEIVSAVCEMSESTDGNKQCFKEWQ